MARIIKATIAVEVELTELTNSVWCTTHTMVHQRDSVFGGVGGEVTAATKWRCGPEDWQSLWRGGPS